MIFPHDLALLYEFWCFSYTVLTCALFWISTTLLAMSEKKCCVPGCGLDSEILHRFPNPDKDIDRFRTWIYNIGGDILAKDNKYIYRNRKVCHLHFEVKYRTRNKCLSANAVPTLNLTKFSFVKTHIDRDDMLESGRPTPLTSISCEFSCTHHNPKDVAFAISEVYKTMYSSSSKIRSLRVESLTGARIPVGRDRTLFLVFTQDEKRLLTDQGYGSGEGSRVLTINEAQGQTFEDVIILQAKTKRPKIHDSVSHAVVAVTRHTNTCVYYTDDRDDAIGRFVARAAEATDMKILEHSLKMAIHHNDVAAIEGVVEILKSFGT